jgi:hypothetical protein
MLDALAAANPFTDNWLGYAPKLRRIFRCLFTTVSITLMALLRLLPKAKDVRSE